MHADPTVHAAALRLFREACPRVAGVVLAADGRALAHDVDAPLARRLARDARRPDAGSSVFVDDAGARYLVVFVPAPPTQA